MTVYYYKVTNQFYDSNVNTDIPVNAVAISGGTYVEALASQEGGNILTEGTASPVPVPLSKSPSTNTLHELKEASTTVVGHISSTMVKNLIRPELPNNATEGDEGIAGLVTPDGKTITITDARNCVISAVRATNASYGIVMPDNNTLEVSNDALYPVLRARVATENTFGSVCPDNTTLKFNTDGRLGAALATTVSPGAVIPNGEHFNVSSTGVLSFKLVPSALIYKKTTRSSLSGSKGTRFNVTSVTRLFSDGMVLLGVNLVRTDGTAQKYDDRITFNFDFPFDSTDDMFFSHARIGYSTDKEKRDRSLYVFEHKTTSFTASLHTDEHSLGLYYIIIGMCSSTALQTYIQNPSIE